MPIRTVSTQNIPFLTKYIPYALPSGTVECFTVGDMVEYKTSPISFEYFIGESANTVEFLFKNITNETVLEVDVRNFSSSALVTESKDNITSIKIEPLQSQSIKFKVNTDYVNTIDSVLNITGSLNFTVKNVFNNKVVTKSGSLGSTSNNFGDFGITPTPTPTITTSGPTIVPSSTPIVSSTVPAASSQIRITPTPTITRVLYYCCFEDVTNPGTCIGPCTAGTTPCNLLNNSISCLPS